MAGPWTLASAAASEPRLDVSGRHRAPSFIVPAFAYSGLAAGMTRGPTGFARAERYQYNPDMPEVCAIEAAKALEAAGKAPPRLIFDMSHGAIGQFTKPYLGKRRPSRACGKRIAASGKESSPR